MLDRLAAFADRHARRIVAGAVLIAVAGGVIGVGVAKRLGPYHAKDPASESVRATNRLTRATGLDQEQVVAVVDLRAPPGSLAGRDQIAQVARTLRADRDVGRVVTPFEGGSPQMISRDARHVFLTASFNRSV